MRKYKNAKTVSIHFTRAVYFYLIFHIHIYSAYFFFPSRFLSIAPSCSDIFSSISTVSSLNRNDVGRLRIPLSLSLSSFLCRSTRSFCTNKVFYFFYFIFRSFFLSHRSFARFGLLEKCVSRMEKYLPQFVYTRSRKMCICMNVWFSLTDRSAIHSSPTKIPNGRKNILFKCLFVSNLSEKMYVCESERNTEWNETITSGTIRNVPSNGDSKILKILCNVHVAAYLIDTIWHTRYASLHSIELGNSRPHYCGFTVTGSHKRRYGNRRFPRSRQATHTKHTPHSPSICITNKLLCT